MRWNLIVLATVLFAWSVAAQVAPDPAGVKWKQINSDLAKVVYPAGKNKEADRLMNLLTALDKNNSNSIGPKSRKIIITLHDQTIIPNGSVSTFPYQSNFFMTPPQSPLLLGSGDWMDLLSIHEYRHAQQNANLNVGLTRALTFFLGDAGLSTTAALVVPNWYSEGDAVIMETALTPAGRGRMPRFHLEQRAAMLNDISYSYMKVRNGSLKDWMPDHYPLGYTMCAYARAQHGNDVWARVLRRAAGWQGLIYPFSKALKKETGLTTTALYEKSYEVAKAQWQKELAQTKMTTHEAMVTEQQVGVQFYDFPLEVGKDKYLTLYSSYQDPPGLYLINEGKRKKLIDQGSFVDKSLSANSSHAVWAEIYRNPRYEYRNYSDIIVFDFLRKERKRLTRKAKYFSPTISEDGKGIVAANVDINQHYKIHVLDPVTAEVIYEYNNPDDLVISFPRFAKEDDQLIFLGRKNNESAILLLDETANKYTEIVPWTSSVMADLFVKNNTVYFTASFSGIDNIYAAELRQNAKITQLTSVKLGAYTPSVSQDGQRLLFSNTESNGIYLASMELASVNGGQAVSIAPRSTLSFSENYLAKENPLTEKSFSEASYTEKSFAGLLKGFQLYAWYPEPTISEPAINLEAVNNLRSLGANGTFGYNINEKELFSSVSVQRSRGPIVSRLSFENRGRAVIRPNEARDRLLVEAFRQNTASLRFSLPLTFNNGAFTQGLDLIAGIDNRWIKDRQAMQEVLADYEVVAGTFRLGASNVKRRARQNVFTRFGQSFFVQWQNVLNNTDPNKSTTSFTPDHWQWGATFFTPGLHKNHSIRFNYGHRAEDYIASYQFNSGYVYPRGYDAFPSDRYNRYSIDYRLPLCYPDWGFAGITYFRRVRMNLFYDRGVFKILDNRDWSINSVGAELLFDNSILNVGEISIGVRYSHRFGIDIPDFINLENQPHQFDFILTSPFE